MRSAVLLMIRILVLIVTGILFGARTVKGFCPACYIEAFGDNDYGQLFSGDTTQSPGNLDDFDGLKTVRFGAIGDNQTLVQLWNGDIYAAGANDLGQLGLGDYTNRIVPTLLCNDSSFASPVHRIVAGYGASAVITHAGQLYVFGDNGAGQLDPWDTETLSFNTPHLVDPVPGARYAKVAFARHSTAVLALDGRVYTWGRSEHGQTGYGIPLPHTPVPVVPGLLAEKQVVDVAAGVEHFLFLTSTGRVYGLGGCEFGQCGSGDQVDSYLVTEITSLFSGSFRVIKLLAGDYHSGAVTDKGGLYLWGSNGNGQLCRPKSTPAFTSPVVYGGSGEVVDAALGSRHTVLSTLDFNAYACGASDRGQLGLSVGEQDREALTSVTRSGYADYFFAGGDSTLTFTPNDPNYRLDKPEFGGHVVTDVSVPQIHYDFMFLATEGEAGSGDYSIFVDGFVCAGTYPGDLLGSCDIALPGPSGVGRFWYIAGPDGLPLPGTMNEVHVLPPALRSVFPNPLVVAAEDQGEEEPSLLRLHGRGFGDNSSLVEVAVGGAAAAESPVTGMSGDGAAMDVELASARALYDKVRSAGAGCGANVSVSVAGTSSVFAGSLLSVAGSHSSSGVLFAFGTPDKRTGLNGDPRTSRQPVPVLQAPECLAGYVDTCAGFDHTLALLDTGAVLATGGNQFGQLGLGDQTERTAFTVIAHLAESSVQIASVACGYKFSMVISSEGQVYSFGFNANGNLGLGHTDNALVPTVVPAFVGLVATKASLGFNHAMILMDSGQLYGTGKNTYGAAGLNESRIFTTPAKAESLGSSYVTDFCAGKEFSVAIVNDGSSSAGTMYSFGTNQLGELGHGSTSLYETVPQPVDAVALVGAPRGVACGNKHVLVHDSGGRVYSWGSAEGLGLGPDQTAAVHAPTPVPALASVVALAVYGGDVSSVVVTSEGKAYAFGNGQEGQLGTLTVEDTRTPHVVPVGGFARAAGLGLEHSMLVAATSQAALCGLEAVSPMFVKGMNGTLEVHYNVAGSVIDEFSVLNVTVGGIAAAVVGHNATAGYVVVEAQGKGVMQEVVVRANGTLCAAPPLRVHFLSRADLGLSLRNASSIAVAGESAAYVFRVSNEGPEDSVGVVIRVAAPGAGFFMQQGSGAYVDDTPLPCISAGLYMECAVGNVANATSTLVNLTLAVASWAPASADSVVAFSVRADTPDPEPRDNALSVSLAVARTVGAEIASLAEPAVLVAGDNARFGLSFSNTGPSDALLVAVDVAVSSEAKLESVSIVDPEGTSTAVDAAPTPVLTCSLLTWSVANCLLSLIPPGGVELAVVSTVNSNVPELHNVTLTYAVTLLEVEQGDADRSVEGTDSALTTVRSDLAVAVAAPAAGVYVAGGLESISASSVVLALANHRLTVSIAPVSAANNGPSDARDILLECTLPNATYSHLAKPNCVLAGLNLTCSIGVWVQGEGIEIALAPLIDSAALGTMEAACEISSSNIDPLPANNDVVLPLMVVRQADIILTASAYPDPSVINRELNYSVSIRNNGPSNAGQINIESVLDVGLAVVAVAGGDPRVACGGGVACTVSALERGAEARLYIDTRIDSAEGFAVSSVFNATAANVTELDAASNAATVDVEVAVLANLTVNASVSSAAIPAGSSLNLTVSVANEGPSFSAGTVVRIVSGDLFWVADSGVLEVVDVEVLSANGTNSSDTATTVLVPTTDIACKSTFSSKSLAYTTLCDLGVLPANETVVFVLDQAVASSYLNDTYLDVAVESWVPTLLPASFSSKHLAISVYDEADLALSIADSPDPCVAGTAVAYTVCVDNTIGPSYARNVSVLLTTDPLLKYTGVAGTEIVLSDDSIEGTVLVANGTAAPGCDQLSHTALQCGFAQIVDGERACVELSYVVDSIARYGTWMRGQMTSHASSDPVSANDAFYSATLLTTQASLSLAVSAEPAALSAGENAVFAVAVGNGGPSDARDLEITIAFPSDIQYKGNTYSRFLCNYDAATRKLGCTKDHLALHETLEFNVTVATRSDSSVGSHITSVSVASDTDTASASAAISVARQSDIEALGVTSGLSAPLIAGGTSVPYSQFPIAGEVINRGPSVATGVSCTFTLSGHNFTLVDFEGAASCVTVSAAAVATVIACELGELCVGCFQNPEVELLVAGSDYGSSRVEFVSDSGSSVDASPGNNVASLVEDIEIESHASLYASISESADPVVSGRNMVYSCVFENLGPSVAHNVSLLLSIPNRLVGWTVEAVLDAGMETLDALEACNATAAASALEGGGETAVVCTHTLLTKGARVSLRFEGQVGVASGEGAIGAGCQIHADSVPGGASRNVVAVTTAVVEEADLELDLQLGDAEVISGRAVEAAFAVTNQGPSLAHNVSAVLTVSGAASFDCGDAEGEECYCASPSRLVCPAALLAPATSPAAAAAGAVFGANASIATAADCEGEVVVQASVAGDTEDTAAAGNQVVARVKCAAEADVGVALLCLDFYVAGRAVSCRVAVANGGPSLAKKVVVSLVVPVQLSLQDTSSVCQDQLGQVVCDFGDLDVSGTSSANISFDSNSFYAGPVAISASAGTSAVDINRANNAAVSTFTAVRESDLSVSLQASASTPSLFLAPETGRVGVTALVHNNGPSAAADVVLLAFAASLPVHLQVESIESANASLACQQQQQQGAPGGSWAGGNVTCLLTHLAADAFVAVTVFFSAPLCSYAGTDAIAARVASSVPDHHPGNNGAAIAVTILQAPPVLARVEAPPLRTAGGDVVTVVGSCLFPFGVGASIAATSVSLSAAGAAVARRCTGVSPLAAPPADGRDRVQCVSPAGSGAGLLLSVAVGALSSNALPVSYAVPDVLNASSANTTGGRIELEGREFGTDSSLVRVWVAGAPCAGAEIVTDHSRLTCLVAEGTGTGHSVAVSVDNQTTVTANLFDYNAPRISAVGDITVAGGWLEIYGYNFGSGDVVIPLDSHSRKGRSLALDDMEITVGGQKCTNITIITPHVSFKCHLNPMLGTDVSIVLNVDGQVFDSSKTPIGDGTNVTEGSGGVFFNPLGQPGVKITNITQGEEGGAPAIVSLSLLSLPMYTVKVPILVEDREANGAQSYASPDYVIFGPGNFSTAVNVSVFVALDHKKEEGFAYVPVMAGPTISEDPRYRLLENRTDVVISDRDLAGIIKVPDEISVSESGTEEDISITLMSKPTATVFVFASTTPPESADMEVSPAFQAILPEQWETGTSFTVKGKRDYISDGLSVTQVHLTVRSEDPFYDEFLLNRTRVVVTDIDPGPLVLATADRDSIREGSGDVVTVFVSLRFRPDTEPLVVDLSISDATACFLSVAELTFMQSSFDVAQAVIVSPVDDDVADGSQRCVFSAKPRGVSGEVGLVRQLNLTTLDNENPGIVASRRTLAVTELGDSDVFALSLRSQPYAGVEILLLVSPAKAALSGSRYTFTPSNWSVPQDVVVTGLRDDVTGRDYFLSLRMYVTSQDRGYHLLPAPTIIVKHGDRIWPRVFSSVPTVLGLAGGSVTLYGSGFEDGPLFDVQVSNVSVTGVAVVGSNEVRFDAPEVLAEGYHGLYIRNERGAWLYDQGLFYTASCALYGLFEEGGECVDCPAGGICPGGNRLWADEGWWTPTEPSPFLKECVPREACPGGRSANCSAGYSGEACVACEEAFFRGGAYCKSCTDEGTFLMRRVSAGLLLFSVYLLLVLGDMAASCYTVLLFVVVQLIASSIGTLDPSATGVLAGTATFLAALDADLQFLLPECLLGSEDRLLLLPKLAYVAFFAVPAMLTCLAVSIGYYCLARFGSKRKVSRRRYSGKRHFKRVFRTLLIVGAMGYVSVVSTCLEAVKCHDNPEKTKRVLDIDPSVECWAGNHATSGYVAIAGLALAGVLLPAIVVCLPARALRRRRLASWDLDNPLVAFVAALEEKSASFVGWVLALVGVLVLISSSISSLLFSRLLMLALLLVVLVAAWRRKPFFRTSDNRYFMLALFASVVAVLNSLVIAFTEQSVLFLEIVVAAGASFVSVLFFFRAITSLVEQKISIPDDKVFQVMSPKQDDYPKRETVKQRPVFLHGITPPQVVMAPVQSPLVALPAKRPSGLPELLPADVVWRPKTPAVVVRPLEVEQLESEEKEEDDEEDITVSEANQEMTEEVDLDEEDAVLAEAVLDVAPPVAAEAVLSADFSMGGLQLQVQDSSTSLMGGGTEENEEVRRPALAVDISGNRSRRRRRRPKRQYSRPNWRDMQAPVLNRSPSKHHVYNAVRVITGKKDWRSKYESKASEGSDSSSGGRSKPSPKDKWRLGVSPLAQSRENLLGSSGSAARLVLEASDRFASSGPSSRLAEAAGRALKLSTDEDFFKG